MKKSEFVAKRQRHWEDGRSACSVEQRVLWDVEAAEASGKVWDPEEEPLPERLEMRVTNGCAYVDVLSRGQRCFVVSTAPGTWPLPLSERTKIVVEAGRRWNAYENLRKHLTPAATIQCAPCHAFAKAALAILDGKEGE